MFSFSKAIGLLPLVSHAAVLAMRLKNPFLETSSHTGIDLIPHQFDQDESSLATADSTDTVLIQYTELPIDHFSDCSDTFNNRYFVEDKFYKPGGPIILIDSGESSAGGIAKWLKKGFYVDLLEELGGMGVVWEHRFYGDSVPQPWRDYIQYLTFEQALADLPVMAANFSHPNWPNEDLSPASTPWVMMGCSYPGARAASARQAYPDTIYASIAGGAVVQWEEPLWRYFQPIMRGMRSLGEGGCVKDVQTANKLLQKLLEDPKTRQEAKHHFFEDWPSFWNVSNVDMQEILAGKFTSWQYAKNHDLKLFCDKLEHDPVTNTTAPPEGWTSTKSPEWILDRMAWAYGYSSPPNSTADSHQPALDSPMMKRADKPNAWGYQTCTQINNVILANPALHHFILDFETKEFWEKICQRSWPNSTYVSHADLVALDRKYGGWHMRPSNVLWTTGEFDPWQNMQPLSLLGNAPPVTVLAKPPKCNKQLSQDQIFGHITKGGTHCDDMSPRGQGKQLNITRKLYTESLKAWLPCFEKKDPESIYPTIPPKCSSKST